MAQMYTLELELDERGHGELSQEADRLGLTPAEIARRAVALWLSETEDDHVEPDQL